jgi:hypothetical protein
MSKTQDDWLDLEDLNLALWIKDPPLEQPDTAPRLRWRMAQSEPWSATFQVRLEPQRRP